MPSTPDYRNVDANAVVVGPPGTSGVLQSVGLKTGQILVGKNGYPPTAGAVSSSDGSVVVTPGPGGIDLSVSSGARDKPIASADGSVVVTSGPTSVDLAVAAALRDKAISSPDGSVVVTTGASTVTLSVATAMRDKAITSTDKSVAVVTGTNVDLSVPRPYNYVFNADFEIWGGGTTAAPTGWTVSGAGVTILKATGAGQFKYGSAACAVGRHGTDVFMEQNVRLAYPSLDGWRGVTVTFGCWLWCNLANRLRLYTNDGVTLTPGPFHSGSSTWEFVTMTVTIGASASALAVGLSVQGGDTTGYMDGAILVVGTTCAGFIPSGWIGRKAILHFSTGAGTCTVNPTYYGLGFSSTANDIASTFVCTPFKGVARNLMVTSTAPATCSEYLRNTNIADTALVASLAGGFNGQDVTHEVELPKATNLTMKTTDNTSGGHHVATVELEEIP